MDRILWVYRAAPRIVHLADDSPTGLQVVPQHRYLGHRTLYVLPGLVPVRDARDDANLFVWFKGCITVVVARPATGNPHDESPWQEPIVPRLIR